VRRPDALSVVSGGAMKGNGLPAAKEPRSGELGRLPNTQRGSVRARPRQGYQKVYAVPSTQHICRRRIEKTADDALFLLFVQTRQVASTSGDACNRGEGK
jgi:hypothetical protein